MHPQISRGSAILNRMTKLELRYADHMTFSETEMSVLMRGISLIMADVNVPPTWQEEATRLHKDLFNHLELVPANNCCEAAMKLGYLTPVVEYLFARAREDWKHGHGYTCNGLCTQNFYPYGHSWFFEQVGCNSRNDTPGGQFPYKGRVITWYVTRSIIGPFMIFNDALNKSDVNKSLRLNPLGKRKAGPYLGLGKRGKFRRRPYPFPLNIQKVGSTRTVDGASGDDE